MGWIVNQLRIRLWTTFYYCFSWLFFSQIGKGCRFEGWIDIPQRGGKIIINDGVYICRRVTFTVLSGGMLKLGNNVFIGPGVIMSVHHRMEIGDDSLLAEYVSVYDNTHEWSNSYKAIGRQGYNTSVCVVGKRCWIGAGVRILMGGSLGDDTIVGAGAVLTKSLSSGVVAVGVPARVVRSRGAE